MHCRAQRLQYKAALHDAEQWATGSGHLPLPQTPALLSPPAVRAPAAEPPWQQQTARRPAGWPGRAVPPAPAASAQAAAPQPATQTPQAAGVASAAKARRHTVPATGTPGAASGLPCPWRCPRASPERPPAAAGARVLARWRARHPEPGTRPAQTEDCAKLNKISEKAHGVLSEHMQTLGKKAEATHAGNTNEAVGNTPACLQGRHSSRHS